jgi:hypothetical protein
MFAVKGATRTVNVRTRKTTMEINSKGSCLFTDFEEIADMVTISFPI